MKKLILFLIPVLGFSQFQPSTISCQGSNWRGYHWQLCVDQVTAGNPVNICNNPAGCFRSSDWSVVGSSGGTGIFSMLTVTGSAYFGSVGTPGSITFGDSSTGTTILSSPGTANGTLNINGTPIPTSASFAPIASPTFTGIVTIPNGGVFGVPNSLTLTNATGLPNAGLLHSATTVNGQTCTLGSTCTISTGGNFNGYGMWSLNVPQYANFTWVSQGSNTYVQGTNFLSIVGAASGGLPVLQESCPSQFTSGTQDLYALILPTGNDGTSGGIELDNGTLAVTISLVNNISGTSAAYITTCTGVVTGCSSVTTKNWPNLWITPIWINIHDASGTLSFRFSLTGNGTPGISGDWISLGTSTFVTSPTKCGFWTNSGSSPSSVTALSFSFLSALTAQ